MSSKYPVKYAEQLIEERITPEIQGFWYLNKALELYEPFVKVTGIYTDIAMEYNTTASRVERCIRHAITKSGEKISNGKFIAIKKMEWDS